MSRINISKEANTNYLCKIVKLGKIMPHPNADRLAIATIDFQNVIVGLNMKEEDVVAFFPVESSINKEFLAFTNSFHHKELNADKEEVGFFGDKGRVKAIKLRGERSMGYIVPIKQVEDFTGASLSECVGEEFDMVGDIKMLEKYVIPVKAQRQLRQGKKAQISRLVDGQFHFHVDTSNLRRNSTKINPDDNISITYKVHGTSCIVSNILVKRKLNLREKFLRLLGTKINDTEYDHVYSSRKVCKNEYETK